MPAGTRLATGANQVLEVVFTDGSSFTLGPKTKVLVAAHDYDPETRTGRLEVQLTQGKLRLAGGALNNATPIGVRTPTARIELDNGSTFVAVEAGGRTRTHLLLGRKLSMTSGGQTKVLKRPGFQLLSTAPNTPRKDRARWNPRTCWPMPRP